MTVPEHIRRQAHVTEGDFVEVSVPDGRIVLTPKAVLDAGQAWFWTPERQAKEQEADAALAAGRGSRRALRVGRGVPRSLRWGADMGARRAVPA